MFLVNIIKKTWKALGDTPKRDHGTVDNAMLGYSDDPTDVTAFNYSPLTDPTASYFPGNPFYDDKFYDN